MKKQIAVIELASNELRLKIGEKSDMKVKTVDSLSYPVTENPSTTEKYLLKPLKKYVR